MSECEIWYQPDAIDWSAKEHRRAYWGKSYSVPQSDCAAPSVVVDEVVAESDATVEGRFLRLAADWEAEVHGVSSIDDLVRHRNYQEIIKLDWPVVPYLLKDLQANKRWWFPALYEITKLRPFDASDTGNFRRMSESWIVWGKRKKLI